MSYIGHFKSAKTEIITLFFSDGRVMKGPKKDCPLGQSIKRQRERLLCHDLRVDFPTIFFRVNRSFGLNALFLELSKG